MSWLAKRLSFLFALFAIIVVLLVGVFANIWWFTILKRMLMGGLIFMLLGLILGEYLNHTVKGSSINSKAKDNNRKNNKPEMNNKKNKTESLDEEMMPLDFEEINSDDSNIINEKKIENLNIDGLGEEIDSKKVTDILRNMKDNN